MGQNLENVTREIKSLKEKNARLAKRAEQLLSKINEAEIAFNEVSHLAKSEDKQDKITYIDKQFNLVSLKNDLANTKTAILINTYNIENLEKIAENIMSGSYLKPTESEPGE